MTEKLQHKKTSLLLGWFEKPYYLNKGFNFKLFVVVGMGILTATFLLVYQPKVILDNTDDFINYSIICGFIVSLSLSIYYFLIRNIFPDFFDKENWNIGKHAVMFVVIILILGGILWGFNQIILPAETVKKFTYGYVTMLILEIGFFPIMIYLLFDERYGNYIKNLEQKKVTKNNIVKGTKPIKRVIKTQTVVNDNITIYSYNNKNSLTFNINNLIYITSETNYGVFFILEEGQVKENILRKTLADIEKDLKHFKNILRCHRSFIVNTNYVNNYNSNSQGGYLKIKKLNKKIPLSRKFSETDIVELIS